MDPEAGKKRDMRLGWLEAFVSTAQHLSYAGAATELGISPASVKRDVASLEKWLDRVLILDGRSLELHRPDAEDFLPVAVRVLEAARSLVARQPEHSNGSPLADVRLSDLRSISVLKTCGSYKRAAYPLACSHDQVRRNVKKLEDLFAQKLVIGRSEISLSEMGGRVANVALDIMNDLSGSVAIMQNEYDHPPNPVPDLRLLFIARKAELSVIVSRVERKKKPSKYDKLIFEAAQKDLIEIDKQIESMPRQLYSISGRDVKL